MKFPRRVHIEKGNLDIVPLIDIVFLLLIFFMLTSSFIFQPGIRVNLPRAITSEVIQKENLILVITKDNEIFVNERPLTEDEVSSRLKVAARQDKAVLIKADRTVSFGDVVRLWDMCRQEGVEKINIATTQEGR